MPRTVKYVTRLDRFEIGDYPMVCVSSGRAATKLVPVQARRSTTWPYIFFPSVLFFLTKWAEDKDHPWGLLPFAEGSVGGITVTFERSIGVIIKGAHPAFVSATKAAQGRRR